MDELLGHWDKKELRQVKEVRSGEARELPHNAQLRAFPGLGHSGAATGKEEARGKEDQHNVLLVRVPPFCFSSTWAPTHAKV